MEEEQLQRIKRLAVIALFSDNDFLECLVLKGGSAIDLFHPSPGRASRDLDFSIDGDFTEAAGALRDRFERLLSETFQPEGLAVFDVEFNATPPPERIADLPFWGGYVLKFKLAERDLYEATQKRLNRIPGKRVEREKQKLRARQARDVGPGGLKTFTIELSKHEYCKGKEEREIDGYVVYVYPPRMIACEKLRAICQQIPEYRATVMSRPGTPRARDFFDIHYLSETYSLDWCARETAELLQAMFEAKRVPLSLLSRVIEFRDFHAQGYVSVKETVRPGYPLRDFDFYFDFVVEIISRLYPFGNE